MYTWQMIESGRKVSETLREFLCCKELMKKENTDNDRNIEKEKAAAN